MAYALFQTVVARGSFVAYSPLALRRGRRQNSAVGSTQPQNVAGPEALNIQAEFFEDNSWNKDRSQDSSVGSTRPQNVAGPEALHIEADFLQEDGWTTSQTLAGEHTTGCAEEIPIDQQDNSNSWYLMSRSIVVALGMTTMLCSALLGTVLLGIKPLFAAISGAPPLRMAYASKADEFGSGDDPPSARDTVFSAALIFHPNATWATTARTRPGTNWTTGSSTTMLMTNLPTKSTPSSFRGSTGTTTTSSTTTMTATLTLTSITLPLCSLSAKSSDQKHPSFDVDPGHRDTCWTNIIINLKSDPLKSRQVEDMNRNWCWVGLKEFGCHATLFARDSRPHMTWAEMRQKHVWFVPNPQPPGVFQPLLNEGYCDQRDLGAVQQWTGTEWQQAWQWFSQYVTVYVLNLKADVLRWEVIQQDLLKLGIQHTRVEGIDMRTPGAFEEAKLEGLIPQEYDLQDAQAEANKPYQAMGGILGTLGCAASHFRAQTHAIREAKTPIAVVFEDDALPSSDFIPKLWALVNRELPCEWQVVSLRSMCPYGVCTAPHLTRVQPDLNEPAERCHHGTNYGFQGVMYRLGDLQAIQDRWKRVVFDAARPHCLDVDVALASISDDVRYFAVPFVQYPGFLTERREGSSRYTINQR